MKNDITNGVLNSSHTIHNMEKVKLWVPLHPTFVKCVWVPKISQHIQLLVKMNLNCLKCILVRFLLYLTIMNY